MQARKRVPFAGRITRPELVWAETCVEPDLVYPAGRSLADFTIVGFFVGLTTYFLSPAHTSKNSDNPSSFLNLPPQFDFLVATLPSTLAAVLPAIDPPPSR
ncbi:unnamed protein product [Cuscuta campestris]|uniref:Uncharacterized protein n=1 Tax=Cuscuta campestris TaxID=132261 RepID=A0A484MHP7_9ASTE|nr:unnamed protein product [Cuscuta campestris]